MAPTKYINTDDQDAFDKLASLERGVVNEDVISNIEKKIKESKKEYTLKDPEESFLDEENFQEKNEFDDISLENSNPTTSQTHKDKQDVNKDIKETIDSFINENKKLTSDPLEEPIKPDLKFLEDLDDPKTVYLGRKKSVLKQYGKIATAYIGKVAEKQQEGKQVHVDGLNPHVIFLDGARGTGKSYLLGVIAEELARTNPYIGQIVIDPVGVFWSMKFPNKDPKELKLLEEWGLKPEGLKNLKVFVPEGIKSQVSKDTYDDTFSMYPSLLTPEDWCLTFGIERFSPSGLLLEKTLESVKKGYLTGGTKEFTEVKKISAKGSQYTLEEIIQCLQNNSEFQSSQKGYKPDSIRALVSRFEAAKSWGIFSNTGTPLSKLSRENQLTVLDTSFLDENITALVIGILARRILSARKLLARQEAVKKFGDSAQKAEELLEIEIPPTWMYIDEAHTLIPSGNSQTPATAGIVEYVKQGRRPGCSLVFATQQPSAINTKVLSQVDILISNKLVFNDDIFAIQKRMPAIIPKQYKDPNFIKTLPFATALVGDRSEETSRAFILRAAPRRSQHEGRDAETIREIVKKSNSEIIDIASNMVYTKLEKTKEIKVSFAKDILDVINIKYRTNVYWDELLESLLLKGVIFKDPLLFLNEKFIEIESAPPVQETSSKEESIDEFSNSLDSLKASSTKVRLKNTIVERITRSRIEELSKSNLKKKVFFFKSSETISSIILKYRGIYKISFNIFDADNSFFKNTCYIDSFTGEFIHFINGEFKLSSGLPCLDKLNGIDLDVLFLLQKQQTVFSLNQETSMDEKALLDIISHLKKLSLISSKNNNGIDVFKVLDKNFDLPFNPSLKVLSSLEVLPLKKQDVEFLENPNFTLKDTEERLKKLWDAIEFVSYEEIFWPIWYTTYTDGTSSRVLMIDAVTGKQM